MADERDISIGVMKIAAKQANLICTFRRAYAELDTHVALSADNLASSTKRPGEVMWQQLVRNIKSHDKSDGNFIAEGYLEHVSHVGYKITPKGLAFLGGA